MVNVEDKEIAEKIDALFKHYFLEFQKNQEDLMKGYNKKMKTAFARGFLSGMQACCSQKYLDIEYDLIK